MARFNLIRDMFGEDGKMRRSMQTLQRISSMAVMLMGMIVAGSSGIQSVEAGPDNINVDAPDVNYWTPATSQTVYVNPKAPAVFSTIKSQSPLDVSTARYELFHPDFGWAFTNAAQVSLFNPYEGTLWASNFQFWNGEKIRFSIRPSGEVTSTGPAHNILASTTSSDLYLPLVSASQSVSTLEPNNNPCQATTATAGATYTGKPDDQYDFFKLTVPVLSKVTLTVTNFTVPGQLQFRSPLIGSDCSSPTASTTRIDPYWGSRPPTDTGTALTYFNVNPGTYYARLSTAGTISTVPYNFKWNYAAGTNPFEPNNNQCAAAAVSVGSTNSAFPDDNEDWYYFDLGATSNIQITITNYTGSGQFALYKQQGASCGSITPLVIQNSTSGLATLSSTNQSAGRYFLRIATIAGFNTSTLYSFRVSTNEGVWNPRVDLCATIGSCGANLSGGNVTVYWDGAAGATYMDIKFEPRDPPPGTCGKGSSTNFVQFAPSQPTGSYAFTGIGSGYYAVIINLSKSGSTLHDEKPLKMNCTLLSAQSPSGTEVVTPSIQAANPTPEPTPIPLPTDMDVPGTRPTPAP